jgi:hypothetical protein
MANNQGQERLLITCSPLIRSAGVQAIESALRGQALVDPKDGKWYLIGDMRIDGQKIYGMVYEDAKMNNPGQ